MCVIYTKINKGCSRIHLTIVTNGRYFVKFATYTVQPLNSLVKLTGDEEFKDLEDTINIHLTLTVIDDLIYLIWCKGCLSSR